MNTKSVVNLLNKCENYDQIQALAERLFANSQNQFESKEEVYLMFISLLLSRK